MKDLIQHKLDELLSLKRLKTPQTDKEPERDELVVVSDIVDPKKNETYANREEIKKDGLFKWDKFKKMWVTNSTNLKQAQDRLNSINKKEEFITKLEDVVEMIVSDGRIMDENQIESRLNSYIQDLANATDEKAADAAIRRYFTFQSKFHTYSFTNTILIMIQRPNAGHVAGKTDWTKKFKRYVVAGAQPIWIFAPIISGGQKFGSGDTPSETGDEGLDKAVQAGRLLGFKAVQVYDISDTKPFEEGDDPTTIPKWYSDTSPTELTEKLYKYLTEVIKNENITLTQDGAKGGEKGYSAGGHINMSSPIKGGGEVSTLVHEFAHELMHWKNKSKFYQGDEIKQDKQIKELQAESVSYVVMKHYNIPVEHHSTYISLWKGNKKEILDNMQTIQKVAKYIIGKIEEVAEGDTIQEELYL